MPYFNSDTLGLNLHFVNELDVPTESKPRAVHFLMRLLCDDWQGSFKEWKELIKPSVLRAVLVRKDKAFVRLMFNAMVQGFSYLNNQLQLLSEAERQNPDIQKQINIYIRNCLCFLPFAEPSNQDTISLPEFIDEEWTFVSFNIKRHELTSPSERKFFKQDQFYAYELIPTNPDAQTKMVFQATGYPASDGFFLGLRSNVEIGRTPGDLILKTGLPKLVEWDASLTSPAELIGISLGGAIAISAGRVLNHISNVYAYNPPGGNKKPSPMQNGVELCVVVNHDEPAHELGQFSDDAHILKLTAQKRYRSLLTLLHHAFSFANKNSTKVENVPPSDINDANNQFRNPVIYHVGRGALDVLLIRPFAYGVRPVLQVPHLVVEKILGSSTMSPN